MNPKPVNSISPRCPACGTAGRFRDFTAREMQLGLKEEFLYHDCPECGTLFIGTVPRDLARFYPSDYYSFATSAERPAKALWLRRLAAVWLIASPDPVAAGLAKALSYRRFGFFQWCRLTGARPSSRILDIGCGSGGIIRRMRRFGFTNLTGIDPYAPGTVDEPGLRIFQSGQPPESETFDLVMMNHVLEHLPDPLSGLESARSSLSSGGRLLVRIPIAGSFAHRRYGPHWYNLDAPRHLVVPSLPGFHHLATRAGLRLLHTSFDGEESSFLMSESYRQGYPARSAPRPNRRTRVAIRRHAHRINRTGDGDMGVFVLERFG